MTKASKREKGEGVVDGRIEKMKWLFIYQCRPVVQEPCRPQYLAGRSRILFTSWLLSRRAGRGKGRSGRSAVEEEG